MKTQPKQHKVSRIVTLGASALLAVSLATSASAAILVQDAFNQPPGTILSGNSPTIGSGVWSTIGSDSTYTKTGGTIGHNPDAPLYSTGNAIGFAMPNEGTITLSTDLVIGNVGWIGLGFRSGDTNGWLSSDTPISAMLGINEWNLVEFSVWQGGTQIAGSFRSWDATPASFPFWVTRTDTYNLSLSYNFATDTTTIALRQVSEGNQTTTLYSGVGVLNASSIVAAGLYLSWENSADTHLDNFTVTHVSSVPEPSAAAILAGGLALAAVGAARRRR